MRNCFVTYLATESFLPGLVGLSVSLRRHNNTKLLVLVLETALTNKTINVIAHLKLEFRVVKQLHKDENYVQDFRNMRFTLSKLYCFSLFDFEKIVFLDADVVVLDNIENLFECPSISASIAGNFYPGNENWSELNSGVMVIDPNPDLFNKLIETLNSNTSYPSDFSDQTIINRTFPDWSSNLNLHLHHRYNMPSIYLNYYLSTECKSLSTTNISISKYVSIVHYWGLPKPWNLDKNKVEYNSHAAKIWRDIENEFI